VRVSYQTPHYAEQQQAIADDLAAHLDAAFGSAAVTRVRYGPE
jgi:hypothetical protein